MPRPGPKTGVAAHQAVQDLLDSYQGRMRDRSFQGAEKLLVDSLEVVRVEPDGTVVFSLFLGPQFQHIGNSLHGGAASLILDQCTSLSISPHSAPGYWEFNGGVTRTFTVTCLRAAPANTTVHVRCKVVSIGQTAVLVRGEIVSADGKTIYNVMDHNKVNVILRKEPKDVKKSNL